MSTLLQFAYPECSQRARTDAEGSIIGVVRSVAVAVFASVVGFDRERAFYLGAAAILASLVKRRTVLAR